MILFVILEENLSNESRVPMFTFRKLILGEKMRLFMMFVLFVVFVIYSFQFVMDQESTTNIVLSLIFLVFVSFFFLISEVLRFIYQKATKNLIMLCNPKRAEYYIKMLQKFDIIKGYKTSILVFYTLMYLDLGDYEALEKHIDTPVFQSPSLKLIHDYNKFYLALHKNDFEQATQYFRQITDAYAKKDKKKRKALKTVYSYQMIAADYYLAKKNFTKAEMNLKGIDENFLNFRERTYYYIAYAKFYHEKGNVQKEQSYLEQAKAINDTYHHVINYGTDVMKS